MSRAGERFRSKQRVELILGEQFLFQYEVVDAAPARERLARHLGGVGVSDVRIERGDDADGALDALAQVLAIRGYANHAAIRQRAAARAQVVYALENRMRYDRLERVELQLAGPGGEKHCQIVADHLEGDLIDDLRDDWIDLARHDARTGLHWRQIDFTQADARSRRQQAKVVAGFRQLDRDAFQHAGELHEGAAVLRRFNQIGGGDDGNPGDLAKALANNVRIVGVRVNSGSDRGRPQIDLADQRQCFL